MDFQLTRTQQMTQREMGEFVRKEVVPLARQWDQDGTFASAHYQQALALGIMDMTLPETLDGTGEDFLCFIMALEAFAHGSAALALSIGVTESLLHFLYRYGGPHQQQQYMLPLHRGEIMGALANMPDQNGTAAADPLRVHRHGSDYRLNGMLPYVPHAPVADMALLFAPTEDGELLACIVDRGAAGFSVSDSVALMGFRGFPMGRVEIKDVQVRPDQILGRGGLGGSIFEALLSRTQIVVGAIALGIAQAALEAAAGHSKARVQFSKPLAQMQATQNKIADMAVGISAARLLVYQAADESAAGVSTTAAAMAKVTAAEVAMEMALARDVSIRFETCKGEEI